MEIARVSRGQKGGAMAGWDEVVPCEKRIPRSLKLRLWMEATLMD